MVILERHDQVNAELDQLITAATVAGRAPVTAPSDPHASARRRPRRCSDVVRAAFDGRPPLDPPTAALDRDRRELADLLAKQGGLLARVDGQAGRRAAARPESARPMYLRRFGVSPDGAGPRRRGRA